MRAILALALLLLVAPAAMANDPVPPADATPAVVQPMADAAPVAPAPLLDPVQVERRAVEESSALAAQDMPQRGSFWWLVGVIVVAGIILVLVLD